MISLGYCSLSCKYLKDIVPFRTETGTSTIDTDEKLSTSDFKYWIFYV